MQEQPDQPDPQDRQVLLEPLVKPVLLDLLERKVTQVTLGLLDRQALLAQSVLLAQQVQLVLLDLKVPKVPPEYQSK
jgi:hypothetical protein